MKITKNLIAKSKSRVVQLEIPFHEFAFLRLCGIYAEVIMDAVLNYNDAGQAVSYSRDAKEYFALKGFTRKIDIFLERENFIIKTAANTEEVMKAIDLRTKVFLEELNNKQEPGNLDIDEYDILSDHLLLIDKTNNGKVIGTYRFNSNMFSNAFYSEHEFNIFNILTMPGIKVELGRACIHKDYRGGMTLSLLWTGMHAYFTKLKADYLFGCSSFNIPGKNYVAQLYKLLMEKYGSPGNMRVFPREKYKISDLDLFLLQVENSVKKEYLLSQRFIPGLVKGYFTAGAKVCGEPIYDPDFNCYDFFTLLEIKNLNQDYVNLIIV